MKMRWRVVGGVMLGLLALAGCSSGDGDSADSWNESRTEFDAKANERALAVLARLRDAGIACTEEQTEEFSVLVVTYQRQELPLPRHYEQATQLVTEEKIAEIVTCGPDPERHVTAIQKCLDAGYDHVHVDQVGPDQEGFFQFYEREVLPHFM